MLEIVDEKRASAMPFEPTCWPGSRVRKDAAGPLAL